MTQTEGNDGGLELRRIPIGEVLAVGNVRGVRDEDLGDLVASVKAQGILEPLLVTPRNGAGKWPLVFGFRRLRAAKLAGLEEVPVQVRALTPEQVREAQLVENLQREDLNPIDEAHALASFLEDAKVSQAELAKRIGKSQPYVANRLRLLGLPEQVQVSISRGILTPSHGEVLLKIPEAAADVRRELGVKAVAQRIPVNQLEQEVRWKVQDWQREQEIVKKTAAWRKTLKFPNCPTCKRPAFKGFFGLAAGTVSCENSYYATGAHYWNPTTGELVKRKAAVESSYSSPRQKPVKRDETEGPTLRSAHDALAIAKALVNRIEDPEQIRRVFVNSRYGGAEISIRLGKVPAGLKELDLNLVPHAYSTGERSQVQVEAYDSKRRKALKAAFATWERKYLPKVKAAKKAPVKVDPKLLEGTVGSIKIPRGAKNLEVLEELRKLEAKGKARNGVLDAIDQEIRSINRSGEFGDDLQ